MSKTSNGGDPFEPYWDPASPPPALLVASEQKNRTDHTSGGIGRGQIWIVLPRPLDDDYADVRAMFLAIPVDRMILVRWQELRTHLQASPFSYAACRELAPGPYIAPVDGLEDERFEAPTLLDPRMSIADVLANWQAATGRLDFEQADFAQVADERTLVSADGVWFRARDRRSGREFRTVEIPWQLVERLQQWVIEHPAAHLPEQGTFFSQWHDDDVFESACHIATDGTVEVLEFHDIPNALSQCTAEWVEVGGVRYDLVENEGVYHLVFPEDDKKGEEEYG